jgi:hypothetical protein
VRSHLDRVARCIGYLDEHEIGGRELVAHALEHAGTIFRARGGCRPQAHAILENIDRRFVRQRDLIQAALGHSKKRRFIVASSIGDLLIASTLAIGGIAMAPLPASTVLGVLAAAIVFAIALDLAKVPVFNRLGIT